MILFCVYWCSAKYRHATKDVLKGMFLQIMGVVDSHNVNKNRNLKSYGN